MTTAACNACAKAVSKEAPACPHCGQPNPVLKKGTNALLGLVIFGVGAWWYLGGGLMSHAENEVVEQMLEQYQIASRSGDPMQVCVHAGIVTAAYLQAKDEAKYQEWLGVQKRDCRIAGLPD